MVERDVVVPLRHPSAFQTATSSEGSHSVKVPGAVSSVASRARDRPSSTIFLTRAVSQITESTKAGSAVPRKVSVAARASSVMNCSSTAPSVSSSRKFRSSVSHPCRWFAAGVAASRAVAISGVTERSLALTASSRTRRWCHPTLGSCDSRCGCPSASEVDKTRSPVGSR